LAIYDGIVQEATRNTGDATTYETWVRTEINAAITSMALISIKDGIALAEISLAKAEWLPSQEIFFTYVNILGSLAIQ
jgi:hypothetical protein